MGKGMQKMWLHSLGDYFPVYTPSNDDSYPGEFHRIMDEAGVEVQISFDL